LSGERDIARSLAAEGFNGRYVRSALNSIELMAGCHLGEQGERNGRVRGAEKSRARRAAGEKRRSVLRSFFSSLRGAARRASVTRVHLFVIRDVNACNFAPVITGVVDTKTRGWAGNAGYRAAAGLP